MVWVGTELKFAIDITANGFSMEDDDFKVVLRRGQKEVEYSKSDLVKDEVDGKYYLCFDTTEFGSGDIYIIIYAYVPDTDFSDGIRTEIYKQLLCTVKKL